MFWSKYLSFLSMVEQHWPQTQNGSPSSNYILDHTFKKHLLMNTNVFIFKYKENNRGKNKQFQTFILFLQAKTTLENTSLIQSLFVVISQKACVYVRVCMCVSSCMKELNRDRMRMCIWVCNNHMYAFYKPKTFLPKTQQEMILRAIAT